MKKHRVLVFMTKGYCFKSWIVIVRNSFLIKTRILIVDVNEFNANTF